MCSSMATHAHPLKDHDSLVAAAAAALEASGEHWTAMREAVFAELATHDRPITAYALADRLSETRGKRVAPNSVYRILDLFVAKHLALRIESVNAFRANSHPGEAEDCIFLVCDACGDAEHVHDDALSKRLGLIAGSQNFAVRRPVLELRGACAACR